MKRLLILLIATFLMLNVGCGDSGSAGPKEDKREYLSIGQSVGPMDEVYSAIEAGNYEEAYTLLQTMTGKEAQKVRDGFAKVILSQRFDSTNGGLVRKNYIYDENGNLWKVVDPDSTAAYDVVFTYDDQGNLLSKQSTSDKYVYTYDGNGNVLTKEYVTTYGGYKTTYAYDSNGNLLTKSRVSSDGTQQTQEYIYDEAGVLQKRKDWESDGSEGEEEYTYYATGKLKWAIYHYNEGKSWVREEYTYDEVGRLLTKIANYSGGARDILKYTYDDKGNVLTETDGGIKNAYTYDENGNCLTREETSSKGTHNTYTYTYDADGRMIAKEFYGEWNDDRQSTVYTYDDDGHTALFTRTYERSGTETQWYSWQWMYYPNGVPENVPLFPTNQDMMQVQMD